MNMSDAARGQTLIPSRHNPVFDAEKVQQLRLKAQRVSDHAGGWALQIFMPGAVASTCSWGVGAPLLMAALRDCFYSAPVPAHHAMVLHAAHGMTGSMNIKFSPQYLFASRWRSPRGLQMSWSVHQGGGASRVPAHVGLVRRSSRSRT
jgi:hypothetical protein